MSKVQPGAAAPAPPAPQPVSKRVGTMWKEFRGFAARGNVVDLAVAVVVGGAFGRITTSLVSDIIMPPIGLLLGRVNFDNLYLSLNGRRYESLAAAQTAGAPTVNYGVFINNVLDFFIIALAMFVVVRAINHLKSRQPNGSPAPSTKICPFCLSTIPLKATRCSACTSHLDVEHKPQQVSE
jgi:large conductance mechanosensitive channel